MYNYVVDNDTIHCDHYALAPWHAKLAYKCP